MDKTPVVVSMGIQMQLVIWQLLTNFIYFSQMFHLRAVIHIHIRCKKCGFCFLSYEFLLSGLQDFLVILLMWS